MSNARERGWWSRLIHPEGGYSNPRRIALGSGVALMTAGVLIAVFAQAPPTLVPEVPGAASGALALSYVRSLPEADAAPLLRPVGVAVGDGRIYVADSADAVVRVFSATGSDIEEIGRGALKVPTYVAYDSSTDTVVVSDRAAGSLLRFSSARPEPEEIRAATEPTATWQPLGVDVDDDGRVAVTDSSSRHRLLVLEPDGSVALEIGGTPSIGTAGSVEVALDYPNSVLFAGEQLWVADSNNRRVLVFSAEGELERLIGIDGVARGLAYIPGKAEADAHVAVTDVLGSQIVVLDLEGEEAGRFGSPGTTEGQLAYPNDVAYDQSAGRLYVADTGNARVQVWEVLPGEEAGGAGAGLVSAASGMSAMRLAGLLLAALGLAITGVAVWPRRELGPEESGERHSEQSGEPRPE